VGFDGSLHIDQAIDEWLSSDHELKLKSNLFMFDFL
jgi:hypothetical protein